MDSQEKKYSELTDCLCTSIRKSARNISQKYNEHLKSAASIKFKKGAIR